MDEYNCGDCARFYSVDEWSGECSKHGLVNCMSKICKDFILNDMRKEDEGEMPKVITYGGDTKIGAYKFADRKKVCLCIEKGNEITIYGTFNSEYCANNFMDELGKFIGAKFDYPTEKGGVEK